MACPLHLWLGLISLTFCLSMCISFSVAFSFCLSSVMFNSSWVFCLWNLSSSLSIWSKSTKIKIYHHLIKSWSKINTGPNFQDKYKTMNISWSYLLNLFFHGFDVVLSRFNLFLQFLDLVVQNKFELLQFLVLLLQVIDSLFLRWKNN